PQTFCRFDYPMPLREQAGIALDSKRRLRFEPRRNDRLVNPFNIPMILGWRANMDIKPVLSKYAAIDYIAKYASKAEKQAPAFPELLAGVTSSMDNDATAQQACQKILNKMLGERSYSAQETAHLLLGIPLVRASSSFKTIYIGAEGSFREIGEQQADNETSAEEQMEGVGERTVTKESWLQRYSNRPPEMEDLSLEQVMTKYAWRKSTWKKTRDSTDQVLRVYPRFSPNPEDERYEDYCRTKVILHHPFRNLDAILHDGQLWAEVWAECRAANHTHPTDTLRCWDEENRVQEDDVEDEDEDINPDIAEMDESDWQTWARLRPNMDVPLYGADDLGKRPIDDGWDIHAARQKWNDVNLMSSWIDEQKRERSQGQDDIQATNIVIGTLENEQRAIFDKFINQYRSILDGETPPQVLLNIDGTAGCGKTYLIAAICQEIRKMAADHGKP
ncbi:hypothetical protein CPC08DRAFT_590772, partial [Agrocybe pediades]